MVRYRDEEKYVAMPEAAAIVIAEQGLGVPIAKIAKTAGLAGGTLFVYFRPRPFCSLKSLSF